MLIRSHSLFSILNSLLLCLLIVNNTYGQHVPTHFRNYPQSSQSGYDVQNPYSYPVRNTDVPPCSHVSSIIDNRTASMSSPSTSLNQLPSVPSTHAPASSISYVPVQVAAPSSSVSLPSIASPLRQAIAPPPRQPTLYPQMNGHQAAQQQQLAAQVAAQQLALSPTHPAKVETKATLPYPTYDTDAQVEMRRQLILAQQNIAQWQSLQSSTTTSTTTQAPLTHPTLLNVQSTTPTSSPTTRADSHSLSLLSPDELAAYATRLRQQFHQERQQIPQASPSPPAPNVAIRGQIMAIGTTKQPVSAVKTQETTNSLPFSPQPALTNALPPVALPTTNQTASNFLSLMPLNVTQTGQQQILQVQMPFQPAPKLTHDVNYCDRRQFNDEQLEELHLKRSDYFIYNTSCEGIFFQCAIGQTFVLKCPSVEGQAFDPTISSCNFKNSVRFCPEYDHVLHCTIRETCTPNQFACCALPQQCIEYSRRCDGHRDCADGEDENNCPSCARDQFACVKSGTCIPAKLRCDGKADDCADGSNLDEIGCSKNETCLGKFVCDSPDTLALMKHSVCIDVEKYCDSKKDCPGGEDELNCRLSDDSATKYLSCENQKQQVRKEQWCDGREDCADGSDEKYCF